MQNTVVVNPLPRRRETEKLEKILVDQDYQQFFSRFTKDQIKNFHFFDDIPGLTNRNAFHLQKNGDKNNQCFDSFHFKELCKYDLRGADQNSALKNASKTGRKTMTRKQLRRIQIEHSKDKRYFSLLSKQNDGSTIQSSETKSNQQTNTLSDKMWLYLQVSKLSKDVENENEAANNRTADYMKYLNENKNDVFKWLEFIEYQSTSLASDKNTKVSSSALYERKKSIFERAIQENPTSFRLKFELIKLKAQSVEVIDAYNAFETIEREFYMLLSTESIKLNVKKVFQNFNKLIKYCFELK